MGEKKKKKAGHNDCEMTPTASLWEEKIRSERVSAHPKQWHANEFSCFCLAEALKA